MPEYWLGAYSKMMPRIEAERELASISALLATGGLRMEQGARDSYLRELSDQAHGERRKAPPVTLAQLKAIGARVTGEDVKPHGTARKRSPRPDDR